MDPPKQTPWSLALSILRKNRRWTQTRLAKAMGLCATTVTFWENCRRTLHPENLFAAAQSMSYHLDDVELLLFATHRIADPPEELSAATACLGAEELAGLRREAARRGLAHAKEVEAELLAEALARRIEEERAAADRLLRELLPLPNPLRERRVQEDPACRTWAMVERLCAECHDTVGTDRQRALAWGHLALRAASLTGDGRFRARLQGYVWPFVGNVLRVGNELRAARTAFAKGEELWNQGEKAAGLPLAEWRLFDLKASLLCDLGDWHEALDLQDRALGEAPLSAAAALLVNKAKTLEAMGDLRSAVGCLERAAPLLDRAKHPRLLFAIRLHLAGILARSGRPLEAEKLIPEARQLALQLRSEMDFTRVLWMEARIDGELGRCEQALGKLIQVRKDFCARRLPYEAAMATLEIAVLLLQDEGRFGVVREMAREAAWIFRAQGLEHQVLASFRLFCEAALHEKASATLAHEVLSHLRGGKRSL